MCNWKKLFCIFLCGMFFTLNAQEKVLPNAEEVKTADKEAKKKEAKKAKEEKKTELSISKLKEKIEKVESGFQAKKTELENVEKELTAVTQAMKTAEGNSEENKAKLQELDVKQKELNEVIVKLAEKRNEYSRELAEIEHEKEIAEKSEKNQALRDKYKRDFELLEQLKKQEREKRQRLAAERKALQKQLSEVKAKIRERSSNLNQGNLKIKEVSEKIVLSISKDEDKKLLEEKSDLVLKRTHIEKELDALKRREKKLIAKLADRKSTRLNSSHVT